MNTFIVEAENYKTLQTENVDISEYGITPDSVYSIKFEKGQDDTLMPQYQVRYPAHEEDVYKRQHMQRAVCIWQRKIRCTTGTSIHLL